MEKLFRRPEPPDETVCDTIEDLVRFVNGNLSTLDKSLQELRQRIAREVSEAGDDPYVPLMVEWVCALVEMQEHARWGQTEFRNWFDPVFARDLRDRCQKGEA